MLATVQVDYASHIYSTKTINGTGKEPAVFLKCNRSFQVYGSDISRNLRPKWHDWVILIFYVSGHQTGILAKNVPAHVACVSTFESRAKAKRI